MKAQRFAAMAIALGSAVGWVGVEASTQASGGDAGLAASAQVPLQLLPGARMVGQGTLRFFGLQVYHARLWANPGFQPQAYADSPLALELEYLRSFTGEAIAERSIEEMRRAGSFSEAQGRQWQQALQSVLPDVKSGDRLLGVHRPGRGAQFWQQGRLLGEVADPQFSRLFFGIWLAPSTSEPALRAALLSGQAQ